MLFTIAYMNGDTSIKVFGTH